MLWWPCLISVLLSGRHRTATRTQSLSRAPSPLRSLEVRGEGSAVSGVEAVAVGGGCCAAPSRSSPYTTHLRHLRSAPNLDQTRSQDVIQHTARDQGHQTSRAESERSESPRPSASCCQQWGSRLQPPHLPLKLRHGMATTAPDIEVEVLMGASAASGKRSAWQTARLLVICVCTVLAGVGNNVSFYDMGQVGAGRRAEDASRQQQAWSSGCPRLGRALVPATRVQCTPHLVCPCSAPCLRPAACASGSPIAGLRWLFRSPMHHHRREAPDGRRHPRGTPLLHLPLLVD